MSQMLRYVVVLILLSLVFPYNLFAGGAGEEGDEDLLSKYFDKDTLVVTSTRYLKPVSQVAENMTVITSDMINEMNAHTLAEVLNNVTGIQMEMGLVFGHYEAVNLQGASYRHVRVLIDGVTLNNLSNNFAFVGYMPVQNIDRIEIVKGPASSAWGSALGGVINVITKSGNESVKTGGMLSASYGERDSGDFRAEAGGKVSNLDYYIYGGHLRSGGFSPNSLYNGDSFYTKENLDITDKIKVTYALGYDNVKSGWGTYPEGDYSVNDKNHNIFTTLTLTDSISDQVSLSLSGRYINQCEDSNYLTPESGDSFYRYNEADNSRGATVNLIWRPEGHTIVFGGDYDDGIAKISSIYGMKSLIKSAAFVNDTISVVENVYITPGLRFDNISSSGSFLSPSLGVTYKPMQNTTLRFFAAEGFNAPTINQVYINGFGYVPNPNLHVEKVWSYQTGIETTILKYVWLKMNVFRHDSSDGIVFEHIDNGSSRTAVNKAKQRRQGFEAEMETVPFYNVSMVSGYSFVDGRDLLTQTRLQDFGRQALNIGVRYKQDGLSALLQGHYIVWDSLSGSFPYYNDKAFIFNLNVIKRLYQNKNINTETFLTAHNIFNGSQNLDDPKIPRRWFEAGIRLNF